MSEKDLNALIERLEDMAPASGSTIACCNRTTREMNADIRAAAQALRARQPVPEEEVLARRFHEEYERLAPSFDYETRDETRQFDPESSNGKLMIAVCSRIMAGQQAHCQMIEAIRAAMRRYLPPDSGITAEEFAGEVIGIVDGRK